MSDKKWYDNIDKNGVLCKKDNDTVVRIISANNFDAWTDNSEFIALEYLTPLTAAEWWDFAPWKGMDSAPNNTPIFVRYDDGLVSIEIALNWAVRKKIVAWLPLPGER